MTRDTLKQMLMSIIVGACVAFFSSLFDGLVHMLQGYGNNIAGGGVAAITYALKRK